MLLHTQICLNLRQYESCLYYKATHGIGGIPRTFGEDVKFLYMDLACPYYLEVKRGADASASIKNAGLDFSEKNSFATHYLKHSV